MASTISARAQGLEPVAALAACTVVALYLSWNLLRPYVYSSDALVHQYWMSRFRDPELFTDSLTAELRESARYPKGYEALFRLATRLADPIAFGEWLGVALMAVSGWLIFWIVREHTSWRPAAWIAAGLFLALIDIHRFHGGFPRAFVHPVVLLTVLLALKRRHLSAALVASAGALLYPPAALLAVGVLIVSAVRWTRRGPRLDGRRPAFAALLAIAATIVAVVGPQLASGHSSRVFTAAEARLFPEFRPNGGLHFFAPTVVEYLRQNRSGFDLRAPGSVLVLAALALLLIRPANVRLIKREVIALPVVSLAAFALAQAVLFKLYLPHRYTYPIVAFCAIAVGVTIRPTWMALWGRGGFHMRAFALVFGPVIVAAFAVYAFPLGPVEPLEQLTSWTTVVVGGVVAVLAAAMALLLRRESGSRGATFGAVLTGLTLLGALLVVSDHLVKGAPCHVGPATEYLATVPKDAVIAGDPIDLTCLPGTARRAVVISTKLAPSYEVDYFLQARARMFVTLRAYYGSSTDAIGELHTRYGATHLWVRRGRIREELAPGGARWRLDKEPYGRFVRRVISKGQPAVLHLPTACRLWKEGSDEVYDIVCIAQRP